MSNKKNEHTQIGWPTFPIGELLARLDGGRTLHQGWSPRCEKEPSISETEWGVLKTTSIQPAAFLPEYNKRLPDHLEPRPQIEVKPGDILITCAGPRNRCGIACLVRTTRRRLMMSGKMYRFRPDPARVDPRYLEAYLQSAVAQGAIDEMKTGGNESGLNLTHDRFRKLPVPVAPLDQQKRIVAEIEKQFSRLDEAVANLKRVKANLKRYKAAVLKAAVEGKLTEAWRKQHPDTEPASEHLQRILAERRAKWEQAELAKMQAKGKPPKDDAWKKKYPDPTTPDTTNLPGLPEGWVWATADQLCSQITDGEHIQPRYQPIGYPMLTAKNVRDGYVTFDKVDFIAEEDFIACLKRCAPRKDDVLIVSVGATTGRAAIVEISKPFALVRSVLLLRPLTSPRFLLNWIQAPWCQTYIQSASGSTAQAHLYIKDTRKIPVPQPPAAEQSHIVSEVERHISIIDGAEAQVDANLQRAERLRQAILGKAFSARETEYAMVISA